MALVLYWERVVKHARNVVEYPPVISMNIYNVLANMEKIWGQTAIARYEQHYRSYNGRG